MKNIRLFLVPLFLMIFNLPALCLENAESLIDAAKEAFTGDFPEMKKDGVVRVLIPFSASDYFIQNGAERGISAEILREFEKYLNAKIKRESERVRVLLIPTRRDGLISGLVDGIGDIAVADLTITQQRLEKIDFSEPFIVNVREVVVTSNATPDLKSVNDMAGLEVHVRKSSSYYESLQETNKALEAKDLAPVDIVSADEWLEDEDLMEMVQTGVIGATIVDEYKAKAWLDIFDRLKIHSAAPLREGGSIAWAFRKNSPKLADVINGFQAKATQGTLLGNILLKRYYKNTDWITNPKTEAYRKKLNDLRGLFGKYGEKYKIDPLLLAALAFQESRFDNRKRNKTGAVGIMQMMPKTAADKNIRIGNIRKLENNIEAGAKYLRFMADYYFSEGDTPDDQKILMALASYNAGPERVARLRKKAEDPNRWFKSVEWQVELAAGSEPVRYVKNIYIYYTLFKSFEVGDAEREKLKRTKG